MNSVGTAVSRGPHAARLGAVLVLTVSLAIAGCEWVFYEVTATVLHRATIRVDGRDYTSEAVYQSYRERIGGRGGTSAWGRVLAFRLQDDRVIVLPLHKTVTWACATRADGAATGCKDRWNGQGYLSSQPEGYIFDSATKPTFVEAFQLPPRGVEFISRGHQYKPPTYSVGIPISEVAVELVSYSRKDVIWGGPRDTLDRDFPGYDDVNKPYAEKPIGLKPIINIVPLPSRKER